MPETTAQRTKAHRWLWERKITPPQIAEETTFSRVTMWQIIVRDMRPTTSQAREIVEAIRGLGYDVETSDLFDEIA